MARDRVGVKEEDMAPAAHDPSKKVKTMMTTADMAMRTLEKSRFSTPGSRSKRCIMVGTRFSTSGRYSSIRSSMRPTRNRSFSITRPPWNSMTWVKKKGPL